MRSAAACAAEGSSPSTTAAAAQPSADSCTNATPAGDTVQPVGLFGERAVVQALKALARAPQGQPIEQALMAHLSEQEEALMALQRASAERDAQAREMLRLYEAAFGLPPTSAIADEIRAMLHEGVDTAHWEQAFAYAARRNKRSWAYVRKLLRDPSADIFLPSPANDAADFARASPEPDPAELWTDILVEAK